MALTTSRLTLDRLSTSTFLKISNLPACCIACLLKAAVSEGSNICTASGTFQPFGRFSKARRSALLAFVDPVLLGRPSIFFDGRPRSIILLLSETLRWWNEMEEADRGSTADIGVEVSVDCSSGASVVGVLVLVDLGLPLDSGMDETGVGSVEVVVAE